MNEKRDCQSHPLCLLWLHLFLPPFNRFHFQMCCSSTVTIKGIQLRTVQLSTFLNVAQSLCISAICVCTLCALYVCCSRIGPWYDCVGQLYFPAAQCVTNEYYAVHFRARAQTTVNCIVTAVIYVKPLLPVSQPGSSPFDPVYHCQSQGVVFVSIHTALGRHICCFVVPHFLSMPSLSPEAFDPTQPAFTDAIWWWWCTVHNMDTFLSLSLLLYKGIASCHACFWSS